MFGSTSLSPTGSVGTLLVSPEVSTVKDMADQGFSWGTDIPVHSAQRRLIMMNEHLRSETTLNNLAQLESARRKQSLEMKRLFVRYVSHEIRTPLSTVTIGLDLIRKLANGGPVTVEKDGGADVSDADETDQMKMATISSIANEAEESCQVAVSILNDLLLYEKIEGEILALERSKNPAVELIMDIARQFSIQSKAQRVELAFTYDLSCFRADELEKPSVFVLVDRPKMSQVLRNLLSNAFKFSSEGSIVKVHMSVRDKMASGPSTSSSSAIQEAALASRQMGKSLPAGKGAALASSSALSSSSSISSGHPARPCVRVEVQDSGPGISEDDIDKLFKGDHKR